MLLAPSLSTVFFRLPIPSKYSVLTTEAFASRVLVVAIETQPVGRIGVLIGLAHARLRDAHREDVGFERAHRETEIARLGQGAPGESSPASERANPGLRQ